MKLRQRGLLGLGATTTAVAMSVALSTSAHADPIITVNQNATIKTVVKKPNKTVTFTGTQAVHIDLGAATDNITADLNLGSATMPVDLPIIPGVWSIPGVATATMKIVPIAPAKGTLAAGNVDITQDFNIQVTRLTPAGFSWLNLVPSTCKTSTPVSMKLTGAFSVTDTKLTGDYTIPSFKGCGLLLTPIITSLTSGSGNTVNASFTLPAA